MRTIAVTGAGGFVGRYLCAALEQRYDRVLRLGRGPEADRQTDYGYDSLVTALSGADAVVHLAGRRMTREDPPMDIRPFWEPNVACISDLVAASRETGTKRIVFASTIAIYAVASGLPYRETAPPHPVNAYALSKLMAEAHLEMLTRAQGPAAVSLRFAAIYGHGEKGTPALMHFVNQASAGETLRLTGNPDHRIDQIYIKDAVSAVSSALATDATGVFNIGGGRAIPVSEIAETVNDVFENAGNIQYQSDSTSPMPQTAMALDAAKAALNWAPAFSLRDGLMDFKAIWDKAVQTKERQ